METYAPQVGLATLSGGQQNFDLLTDLAIILCVAAVTTVVFQRLRQPVVLGYLLAGLIVGPHLPIPLFANERVAHHLSELGVILLMFSLGLEFSLRQLIQVGPTAGIVALIQCSLMMLLGYLTGAAFNLSPLESLFTGAILAISSTTIIVKAFNEQGVKGSMAELVFGILIVEDLIGILLLAILTTLGSSTGLTPLSLALTAGKLAGFLLGLLVLGMLLVPRFMRFVVRLGRNETTLVASVGLCFGFALLARAFGYSVALGAFLGGALVAESGEARSVEHLVAPVRDVFAAVFFVAVGMLIDPRLIVEHAGLVAVLTIVVILGKFLGVTVGGFLAGYGIRTSVQAGMSMAQIGEFSFIIAALGLATGATGHFLYPVAVAVSAITTLITPWLIRYSGQLATQIDQRLPHAIQTYASLYGSWIEQLRTTSAHPTAWAHIRKLLAKLILDLAAIAGIAIGTSLSTSRVVSLAQKHVGIGAGMTYILLSVATLLILTPFFLGAYRIARALGLALTFEALPSATSGLDLAEAPRRAFLVTLQLAILLLAGGPLVALLQPFYPSLPGVAVLLSFVLLLIYPLWRSATNLQGHARAGAQVILEALAAQSRDQPVASVANQIQSLVPGLGETSLLILEPTSEAIGLSLKKLALRGRTGATVIAIQRGPNEILYPNADEKLLAGDILVVLGTSQAIQLVSEILRDGNSIPPATDPGP